MYGEGLEQVLLAKTNHSPTHRGKFGFMEESSQHREVERPVCRIVSSFGDKSAGPAGHCDVLEWLHTLTGMKWLVQWVLDQDSAQWYLIPDFNLAFWFCVTELLNLLKPQFPYEKMSLTVCLTMS